MTCIEEVLGVYQRPYDLSYPIICMDESPKQLIGEVRQSFPAKPGSIEKVDDGYVRLGVAELFLAVEPLTGKMVAEVENKRAKKDWAQFIRDLVDVHYPTAKKVILVMDNLNTHKLSSLYEAFDSEEAHRLRERLELHHTQNHGSWLNIAEIGFSILKRQCILFRVDEISVLRKAVKSFIAQRNAEKRVVNWQFTASDARIRLRHLYPELKAKILLLQGTEGVELKELCESEAQAWIILPKPADSLYLVPATRNPSLEHSIFTGIKIRLIKLLITAKINAEDEACNLEENF